MSMISDDIKKGTKLTHCLRCKCKTGNSDVKVIKGKNNKNIVKSQCLKCQTSKSVFIKGGGLLSSILGSFGL